MADTQSINLKISWMLTFLWTALGYFVYGGFKGALAILILSILFDIVLLAGLIPFVGVVIEGLVMNYFIMSWVFSITNITATWLTNMMFWVNIIFGLIFTVITSIATIVAISKR
jgi:hypothetical protein